MSEEFTALDLLHNIDADNKYRLLRAKQLKEAVDAVVEGYPPDKPISVDIETSGLDRATCDLYGYSFSFSAGAFCMGESFWVPISEDPGLVQLSRMLGHDRDIENRPCLMFNAGYDLAILERFGVSRIDSYQDVMLACYFADPVGYKTRAGLKAQAQHVLEIGTIELKELLKAKLGVKTLSDEDMHFDALDAEEQRVYACQDADITLRLWEHSSIQKGVKRAGQLWKVENDIVRAIMEMEMNGIDVDLDKCRECGDTLDKLCTDLSKEATELALRDCETILEPLKMTKKALKELGTAPPNVVCFKNETLRRLTRKKPLNIGSATQKSIILFEELGLKPTDKTDAGKWSTKQNVLENLADEHPIVKLMADYGKWKQRITNYTNKIPTVLGPDGRIHAHFRQIGPVSGRMSCSKPNLQGVSKEQIEDDPVVIRDIFVAEPKHVLISADYDQMEMRIGTSLSGEPRLMEVFTEKGDVHAAMAKEIFRVKEPTQVQRYIGKQCNFIIFYGGGAYALRKMTGLPMSECQDIINKWFEAVPVLANWIEAVHDEAARKGYAETFFGRKRPLLCVCNAPYELVSEKMKKLMYGNLGDRSIEDIEDIARRSLRNQDFRYALSQRVQGTAADLMKVTIRNMHKAQEEHKLYAKMWAVVHDEICFNGVPDKEDVIQKEESIICETMEIKLKGWVPLTVDAKHNYRWGQCK